MGGFDDGRPGYGTTPPQVVYVRSETHPYAIYAMVAAGLAWVVCPVVPALFALRFCGTAQEGIDESRGRYTGEGLVTAARVLAWVNLAMVVPFVLYLLTALSTVRIG
jgi:hypothetical protein